MSWLFYSQNTNYNTTAEVKTNYHPLKVHITQNNFLIKSRGRGENACHLWKYFLFSSESSVILSLSRCSARRIYKHRGWISEVKICTFEERTSYMTWPKDGQKYACISYECSRSGKEQAVHIYSIRVVSSTYRRMCCSAINIDHSLLPWSFIYHVLHVPKRHLRNSYYFSAFIKSVYHLHRAARRALTPIFVSLSGSLQMHWNMETPEYKAI